MNINLLKVVVLLSVILGLILGIVTIIPYVGTIAFWVLMCFTSAIIMFYLNSLNSLKINSKYFL